ncbi:hypothetical protein [Prosthecobacter sp.]|uniref:hypothetical protein n=1 Tax=Prosthecobacter sp. TaxID=1965333 RepID=UPI003784C135
MIRPDGTGIWRKSRPIRETRLTWRYEGGGIWQHSIVWQDCIDSSKGPIRFDGQCLLLEQRSALGTQQLVYVRASDDAAVEEHLDRRR